MRASPLRPELPPPRSGLLYSSVLGPPSSRPPPQLSRIGTRASSLLLVWMPAGLGVLALSWSALAFHVGGEAMNAVVLVLQAIAVATLLLGAIGAMIHDDLEEIAAYSIEIGRAHV